MKALLPPLADGALAGAFTALCLAEVLTGVGWERGGWLLLATLALAWRRRWPVQVALVVLLVVVMADPSGQTTGTLATAVAIYSLGSTLRPRPGLIALVFVVTVAWTAVLLRQESFVPSDVAALFVLWIAPFFLGMTQRRGTERAAQAVERSARAEERALIDAELAVMRERTRIARELHDVVSHSLTVVTINAQAVRRALPTELVREGDALEVIEHTARDASAEMRRLLGVLRDGGQPTLKPQPGLDQLPALVNDIRVSGLDVTLSVTSGAVPSGMGITVHHIVQESLTNVLRHAAASRAWVRVSTEGAELVVEVEDDGVGDQRAQSTDRGHGLVGIAERAQVYGGRAELGQGERGFRVRVLLPLGGQP